MANSIRDGGGGRMVLTITKPAREAGLAEERPNGEARRLAPVMVYAVDDLLLVVDRERVELEDRAELVASAIRDSDSIYRGLQGEVTTAGNGYKLQLPGAADAGLREGDTVPTHTADGLLLITDGSRDANRLARDLTTIREEQC